MSLVKGIKAVKAVKAIKAIKAVKAVKAVSLSNAGYHGYQPSPYNPNASGLGNGVQVGLDCSGVVGGEIGPHSASVYGTGQCRW